MRIWFRQHWLTVFAIVFVLGALGSLPYVYYQIMNWIVAGAALLIAWRARQSRREVIAWIFLGVAVTFNPLAPLYLRQDIWRILDIAVALLFVSSIFLLKIRE